jgi:hypothetical protein
MNVEKEQLAVDKCMEILNHLQQASDLMKFVGWELEHLLSDMQKIEGVVINHAGIRLVNLKRYGQEG